jgi:hypothetical protein
MTPPPPPQQPHRAPCRRPRRGLRRPHRRPLRRGRHRRSQHGPRALPPAPARPAPRDLCPRLVPVPPAAPRRAHPHSALDPRGAPVGPPRCPRRPLHPRVSGALPAPRMARLRPSRRGPPPHRARPPARSAVRPLREVPPRPRRHLGRPQLRPRLGARPVAGRRLAPRHRPRDTRREGSPQRIAFFSVGTVPYRPCLPTPSRVSFPGGGLGWGWLACPVPGGTPGSGGMGHRVVLCPMAPPAGRPTRSWSGS